jgi:hypothetical protein
MGLLRRIPLFVLASVAIVTTGGCGTSSAGSGASATGDDASGEGGASGVLDCSWAAGENCWKSTIAAASCLPPSGQQGTLSADEKTCSYASGIVIAFDAPLVVGTKAILPSFTLNSGGAQCMRLEQMPDGITVTTAAGTVSVSIDTSTSTLSVTCPGGATYAGAVATLSACMEAVPSKSEGEGFGQAPDGSVSGHFSLQVDGTSQPDAGETFVFDCATPP